MQKLLGMAIGGTKCIAVLGIEENNEIRILGSRRFATREAGGPYGAFERFAAYGDELLDEFGIIPDAAYRAARRAAVSFAEASRV